MKENVHKHAYLMGLAKAAIEDYARQIADARDAGNLSVTKDGTLRTNPNGVTVKKNTFYGSGG